MKSTGGECGPDISGGCNWRRSGLNHRGKQVPTVRQQALSYMRARALNHWIATAILQIFEYSLSYELVAPARGNGNFITGLITGVHELHRCGRQRGKQQVIADYGNRKRMRCRQASGGQRTDVTKVRRPRADSPERRG